MEQSKTHDGLQALEEENAHLRRENRLLLAGYQAGGGLVALVLLGPGLLKAARRYFRRARAGDPLPPDETAELFAAIVRRVSAVGALGLLVAAIPTLLLWRQNALIAKQNEYFQDQNAKIQNQLLAQARATQKQEADTLLVRRNELLRTIYETVSCEPQELSEGETRCPPKHPLRLRQEAVLALAQLDQERLDLSEADLRGAVLRRVDLRGANLRDADLSDAYLPDADFRGALLLRTDLESANLRNADLSRADLLSANLKDADLGSANLELANLSRADLTGADYLNAKQLSEACGSSETKISTWIVRPQHWDLDHSCPR